MVKHIISVLYCIIQDGVCICDDGYDGEDCSTATNTENIILYIIDGFENIHVNYKLWIHVTGAVIKNTCPFEPYSKSTK